MKLNNFRGELTDISTKKEPLLQTRVCTEPKDRSSFEQATVKSWWLQGSFICSLASRALMSCLKTGMIISVTVRDCAES